SSLQQSSIKNRQTIVTCLTDNDSFSETINMSNQRKGADNMKQKRLSRSRVRLIGAIALVGAILSTSACNADEQTDSEGGGIEASRQVVESIEKDNSLAERLPDEYTDSIKIGMTFTF